MTVYPLIVKRQIKGSSIWEKRNGTVTLSPFFLVLRRMHSAQNKEKGRCSFLACYPGRRCACPGLLSCRPAGTSGWESEERRAKSGERRKKRHGERPRDGCE